MVTKKAERIHANGKIRSVRDGKGHFIGSVSLKKTKDRLMKAIDNYTPPVNKRPVKRGVSKSDVIRSEAKPIEESMISMINDALIKEGFIEPIISKPKTGRLTIYRVYNPSAGQGSGYYFVIKPNSQYETSEAVMTLYNPTTDLIALERAIKKYKLECE